MGAIHAKVYNQLAQSDLVAVVDTDLQKAKKLADNYNCDTYTNFENVLKQQ